MQAIINWFEIPVSNFERAEKFYTALLGAPLKREPVELNGKAVENSMMGVFPGDMSVTGGAIVQSRFHTPGAIGSLVYLNGGDDLSPMLSRVEKAGGGVIMPKTKISEQIGYVAMFRDTEGNHVALHSRS